MRNFFDVLEERKIGFGGDGDIESDARALEAVKAWHVENLLKFKAVFTPEIQRARETLQSR